MSKKLLAMLVFFFTFTCYAAEDSDVTQHFDNWVLIISTDELTDEASYFASTKDLSNDYNLSLNNKYYAIGCNKGKLMESVFIENLPILRGEQVKLDLRADKEKPFQRDSVSTRVSLVNEHITAEEIGYLRDKKKLFIRADTSNGFIRMDFSLKGFNEAVQPVLDACNISAS